MRRATLALLLVLATAPLWAQVSKTFTWTNPSQYADGTTMPTSDIRETRISVSPTSQGTPTMVLVNSGQTQSYQSLSVFTAGAWFARAQTVANSSGLLSTFSNEASFTVGTCQANQASCTPKAPANLTVQ